MTTTIATAQQAAQTLNIDFAAARAMSVVQLHKAYSRAYYASSNDVDGSKKARVNFWSNMIALRASYAL